MKKRTAEDEKQLSMELVFRNANEDWKIEAEKAVIDAAIHLPYLTSDDVMPRIPAWASTHEPRALGPIMARAARDGIIVKANLPAQNSIRRSRHAAPLTVWQSLIFKKV